MASYIDPLSTISDGVTNPFDKQIENRNFLSPIGFKFSLTKAPKVSFFSNTVQRFIVIAVSFKNHNRNFI